MRETANPKVIKWALDRCHKTPGELRNTVSPRVQQWIDGEGKPPTPKQLENLAKATHVLVPYFYEDDIPNLPLQIPDYRTLDASAPVDPSPELYDVINQTLSRQDWLSGYLEDSGEDPLDFIGACKDGGNWKECAAKMRDLLGLGQGWARGKKRDAAVRTLREAIEGTGVYVYAGSYFANSTSRSFEVKEFRGFALSDGYAPAIFLNTSDAHSAQLFTLAHEFAHLLFGETGLDDAALGFSDKDDESKCDAAAAEFLVPAAMVHAVFDQMDTDDALEELGKLTKVSDAVCLRRARDLGRITRSEFNDRYRLYSARLADILSKKRDRRSGGDGPGFHAMQKNHLGGLFPETIYAALQSEYLLYSDAYRLTGMSAKSLKGFFQREGTCV
ncbi:MAG: ImmA/IrrE family metallo-endopeptidase [Coriobacteriales bacterium]|nr:ImmA/IrrE family metallo-endopeptidase [Coriobacteriales bacterium]